MHLANGIGDLHVRVNDVFLMQEDAQFNYILKKFLKNPSDHDYFLNFKNIKFRTTTIDWRRTSLSESTL